MLPLALIEPCHSTVESDCDLTALEKIIWMLTISRTFLEIDERINDGLDVYKTLRQAG